MTKACHKCGEEKSLDNFCKDKQKKDGMSSRCKACFAVYFRENRGRFRDYGRHWLNAHRAEVYAQNKARKKEHPEYARNYERKKRHEDPAYRLRGNLRSRLYAAIKNEHRAGSAVRDLGCSIAKLKEYLAAKFSQGMSWDNYGKWHIDHIKPLAAFDLSDEAQAKKALHHSNLQPLWAADNIRKGAAVV